MSFDEKTYYGRVESWKKKEKKKAFKEIKWGVWVVEKRLFNNQMDNSI